MTLLVDASAMLAIVFDEPEAGDILAVLDGDRARITNGIALWEAARALARHGRETMAAGQREAKRFRTDFDILVAPVGTPEATEAASTFDRYGKRRHPAQLNMGDCFAYACAKTNGARLLYTGADFARTDLA